MTAPPQGDVVAFVIKCPACGQTGIAIWEKPETGAPPTVMINLTREFYQRVRIRQPYRLETVCQRCNTVQAE